MAELSAVVRTSSWRTQPPAGAAGGGDRRQRPEVVPPPGATAPHRAARVFAPTGGTAGDADVDALRARLTEHASTPDAAAPSSRIGTGGAAGPAAWEPPPAPPIPIRTTTADETAASAIGSTDPALAQRLVQALEAAGWGLTHAGWAHDPRSDAAALRLDAAAAWSRHEQERAELLAALRASSAGLFAEPGARTLGVEQLLLDAR